MKMVAKMAAVEEAKMEADVLTRLQPLLMP